MSILQILEELSDVNGVGSAKRKIQILKNNKENQELKDFFFFCLDPNVNFWQTKIKPYNKPEGVVQISLTEAIKKTEKLRNREITGNPGVEYLSEINAALSQDDQNVFSRIIARKPDCGVNRSTVEKVWPGLVYLPSYMRCKGFHESLVKNWDWNNVYSQIKQDGMFLNIILSEQDFETRSGEKIDLRNKNIDTCKEILDNELNKYIENPVLHGEIVCLKNEEPMERSKSNGLINRLKQGGKLPKDVKIVISVWDIIPYHNFINKIPYEVPYSVRLEKLRDAINCLHISKIQEDLENGFVNLVETKRVFSIAEAKRHFIDCLVKGLEGTVLKNGKGIWKSHDSPDQLKMKNEFSFELKITGFKDGNGKFSSTFGSIEAESEDSLLTTFISGINDKERKHINDNRDYYIGKIIEVKASGLFKNDDGIYSPMHPRFVEVRCDKSEADTLQRIIQQEQESIQLS